MTVATAFCLGFLAGLAASLAALVVAWIVGQWVSVGMGEDEAETVTKPAPRAPGRVWGGEQ